ncbi:MULTISPECIES: ABC transporter permease [Streptosporangium]|uniref:Peptide/nickel transport system permease protein n=1 Tax=Streptosporangium brasiliense TaxID=47480 RepID=A0ABT9RFR5_9ACTN|nr:ABC transporter permease [Streptosporangium brasiliense]MDP9867968.1 peptide/nickel transport system permease protein [Streptosporangium brasiliense]
MTAVTHAPATVEVPRHHAFGRFCRAYARRPAGLAGLGLLVAFGALALAAPLFIGDDQLNVIKVDGPQLSPPVAGYPLGTDQAGRSVLLLVIWGARESLSIGIIATALTVVLGSAVGLLAGHYQGRVGQALMHVTDWFIALPSLPLAISLSAVLGQGAASITIAIAVTSWTATARLVRAQTLAVEARPFIERAKVLGAGNTQIMIRHVLPNVTPLILVSSTLTVASAILSEATLTFLGLGDPTSVTWGSMLQAAFAGGAVTAGAWWYLLPPGIAILIVVLGFTLVGRAVEHVLNPRMVDR